MLVILFSSLFNFWSLEFKKKVYKFALNAEFKPFKESSTAIIFLFGRFNFFIAFKYGSGFGLPCKTSSAEIINLKFFLSWFFNSHFSTLFFY